MLSYMPIPESERSKMWVWGRSLAWSTGSNPTECMVVSCDSCVFSDRDLFVGLITFPEESYRLWCVLVWTCGQDNEGVLAHWGAVAPWGKKLFHKHFEYFVLMLINLANCNCQLLLSFHFNCVKNRDCRLYAVIGDSVKNTVVRSLVYYANSASVCFCSEKWFEYHHKYVFPIKWLAVIRRRKPARLTTETEDLRLVTQNSWPTPPWSTGNG